MGLEPPYSFHCSDNKQYDKVIIIVEKDYEYSPKIISLWIVKDNCFKEIAFSEVFDFLCQIIYYGCFILLLWDCTAGVMFAAYTYQEDLYYMVK